MSQPTIPPEIRVLLGSLRSRIRQWLLVSGMARVLAALAILVVVSFVVDRTFDMDGVQRRIYLILAVVIILVGLWRFVARPLSIRVSDESLGHQIERSNPALGETVLSALEFSKMSVYTPGASEELIRQTIDQGQRSVSTVQVSDMMNRKDFMRHIQAMSAGLVLTIALVVAFSGPVSLWFERNILLHETPWPRDTYLTLSGLRDDGKIYIPQYMDLTIEATASGVIPTEATIEWRPANEPDTIEALMVAYTEGRFQSHFESVTEPFRFRVFGGDARTDWIEVVPLPRPHIETLFVDVQPPAYTGEARQRLAMGLAGYPILRGSQVWIEGKASQPLSKIRVLNESESVWETTLADATFSFEMPKQLLANARYTLELTDTQGIVSRTPTVLRIQMMDDKAPVIKAKLNGIGQMILPGAAIPLSATVRDDYGTATANIQWRVQSETGEEKTGNPLPLSIPKDIAPARDVAIKTTFDLQPHNLPTDGHLVFHVDATDRNTISGPGHGESRGFTLRIVEEAEFREDLLEREQELRLRLEALLKQQRQWVEDTQVLLVGSKSKAILATAEAQRLATNERKQRQTIGRIERLCEQLNQMRQEVINNRLEPENGPLPVRLGQHIITPLYRVAAGDVVLAAEDLSQALNAKDTATRLAALRKAKASQGRIVAVYVDVLNQMVQSKDMQMAIRLLREIIERQSKIQTSTQKEMEDGIDSLFD